MWQHLINTILFPLKFLFGRALTAAASERAGLSTAIFLRLYNLKSIDAQKGFPFLSLTHPKQTKNLLLYFKNKN